MELMSSTEWERPRRFLRRRVTRFYFGIRDFGPEGLWRKKKLDIIM